MDSLDSKRDRRRLVRNVLHEQTSLQGAPTGSQRLAVPFPCSAPCPKAPPDHLHRLLPAFDYRKEPMQHVRRRRMHSLASSDRTAELLAALHPKFAGDHQRFLWPIGLNQGPHQRTRRTAPARDGCRRIQSAKALGLACPTRPNGPHCNRQ